MTTIAEKLTAGCESSGGRRQYDATKIACPRSFKHFDVDLTILGNGMRCLLLSSPKVDRAAVSLGVHAGNITSLRHYAGLAHFLEHMVFRGSEKYPNEAELDEFLNNNGGSSNAMTSFQRTVYYAHLSPEKIGGAVDRLAAMFAAPAFRRDCVDREVEAVNAEYERFIPIEAARFLMVWQMVCNPDHPVSLFLVGNNDTLRHTAEFPSIQEANEALRQELLAYHLANYSANKMACCVVSSQPMDELREMVHPHMAAIPNHDFPDPMGCQHFPEIPVMHPEAYQSMVYVIPYKPAHRTVAFHWMMPDMADFWRTRPGSYVAHELGYEGAGSLISYLKQEGLATELVASSMLQDIGASPFLIELTVTEEGVTENGIRKIGDAVFSFIGICLRAGCPDWSLKEFQALENMSWNYRELPQPWGLALDATNKLLIYPPEECLAVESKIYEIDCDQAQKLLEEMKTDNLVVFATSETYRERCNETTPYYDVKYSRERIPQEWLSSWTEKIHHPVSDRLHFPQPNEYIATKFDMKPGATKEEALPDLHSDGVAVSVFHKQHDSFELPRVWFDLDLNIPMARPTEEEVSNVLRDLDTKEKYWSVSRLSELDWASRIAMLEVFGRLIEESLNETMYDASMADLTVDVTAKLSMDRVEGSISIAGRGFDERAPLLLKDIVEQLRELKASHHHIETILHDMKQEYENVMQHQDCSRLSTSRIHECLNVTRCRVDDVAERVKSLEADDVIRLLYNKGDMSQGVDLSIFSETTLEGLVVGNATNTELNDQYTSPAIWKGLIPEQLPMDRFARVPVYSISPAAIIRRWIEKGIHSSNEFELLTGGASASSKDPIAIVEELRKAMDKKPIVFVVETNTRGADDPSGAATITWTSPDTETLTSVVGNLLHQWLDNDMFEELRSQQALGYVAHMGFMYAGANRAAYFNVETSKGCRFVTGRILAFLMDRLFHIPKESEQDVKGAVAKADAESSANSPTSSVAEPVPAVNSEMKLKLSPDQFEQFRKATLQKLSEKPKTLAEMAARWLPQITRRRYDFDWYHRQIEILNKLTLSEFECEVRRWIFNCPWIAMTVEPANKVANQPLPQIMTSAESPILVIRLRDPRSLNREVMGWPDKQERDASVFAFGEMRL